MPGHRHIVGQGETEEAALEDARLASAPASAVVVDTDIVSYLFKHDSRAESYRPHLTAVTHVIFQELELISTPNKLPR